MRVFYSFLDTPFFVSFEDGRIVTGFDEAKDGLVFPGLEGNVEVGPYMAMKVDKQA